MLSMGGKGDPYDNSVIESFFSTLRVKCTERYHFATRETALLPTVGLGFGGHFIF